jgi:hypothetical protein
MEPRNSYLALEPENRSENRIRGEVNRMAQLAQEKRLTKAEIQALRKQQARHRALWSVFLANQPSSGESILDLLLG